MIGKDSDASERSLFERQKKGPYGPDGFAIHLRITGLTVLCQKGVGNVKLFLSQKLEMTWIVKENRLRLRLRPRTLLEKPELPYVNDALHRNRSVLKRTCWWSVQKML